MSDKPGIRLIINLKSEMETIGPCPSCIVWLTALSAESILIGRARYGACSIHIAGGKIPLVNLSLPPRNQFILGGLLIVRLIYIVLIFCLLF